MHLTQIITIFFVPAFLFNMSPVGHATESAPAVLETVGMSNEETLSETTSWLKKKLGLGAAQVDALMKNAAALQSSVKGLSETQLTDKLNNLIVESGITGAQVINRHDPLFWLYRARFGVNNPAAPPQVPAWLTRRGENWHVYLPSHLSGRDLQLKRGDEIIFQDGSPLSFSTEKSGKMTVKVKSLSWDKPTSTQITLEQKSMDQLLLEITQTNRKLQTTGNSVTGILALPATDLDVLRHDVMATLKDYEKRTDQLVIDLRGPYGEGGLSGIEMFLNDKGGRINYSKPLFVLIDRYTSGGREVLAGMLQRHAGATLVGEPSAGRTAPVELTEVSPDKFLLVTEHGGKKTTEDQLKPDYLVKENLMFAAGSDEILKQTLKLVTKK